MIRYWLVRLDGERIRVKWRDTEGILQDQDFANETEARNLAGENAGWGSSGPEELLMRYGAKKARELIERVMGSKFDP